MRALLIRLLVHRRRHAVATERGVMRLHVLDGPHATSRHSVPPEGDSSGLSRCLFYLACAQLTVQKAMRAQLNVREQRTSLLFHAPSSPSSLLQYLTADHEEPRHRCEPRTRRFGCSQDYHRLQPVSFYDLVCASLSLYYLGWSSDSLLGLRYAIPTCYAGLRETK